VRSERRGTRDAERRNRLRNHPWPRFSRARKTLESRVLRKAYARFGEGRIEKCRRRQLASRLLYAVVLCRSREEAVVALARMRAWVSRHGLTLHPDKTHIGDCRAQGQGFEFLGYRFEAGKRWVRKKSLMALRDKIRAKTPRNVGHSIACVIASLNPTLQGWFGYFHHAHRSVFSSIDGFVRRRLRAVLRRQNHRPGQGRCQRDHTQWPNAFFADLGLFTMYEAHHSARQSRCGNN